MALRTSRFLRPGFVYARAELAEAFHIVDASLNNGIFRPKGHDSIWLFVTRDKTPDRTQYADVLRSDRLFFAGQTEGRTDSWIIDHASNGDELLLFYRTRKYEHPGAGFMFVGEFTYSSHVAGRPSSFELRRVDAPPSRPE